MDVKGISHPKWQAGNSKWPSANQQPAVPHHKDGYEADRLDSFTENIQKRADDLCDLGDFDI